MFGRGFGLLPILKVLGGTPNALLASAKAEQGQVQNWNTQLFSKTLRIFDFLLQFGAESERHSQKWNTVQKSRTALPIGVYQSVPLHCGILFYPASLSTLQIMVDLVSFSSLSCSHYLLKRRSQIAYNQDLLYT